MSKQLTTAEFITRATKVHGDRYSYASTTYYDANTKLSIICPTHGEFFQRAISHLRGSGCKKCANAAIGPNLKLGKEGFISRARITHGDRYGYASVEYRTKDTLVEILCPEHGIYRQSPSNHTRGSGCPRCAIMTIRGVRPISARSFSAKATIVHGGKYDYSGTQYIKAKQEVAITCPIHGVFWQHPNAHLLGKGCAKCAHYGPSKGEQQVFDYIATLDNTAMQSDRKLLGNRQELDIVIPAKKLAVEYNGVVWHSAKFGTDRDYHQKKSEAAKRMGYRLIHIYSDEWESKQDWCKAFLRMQIVGPERKVFARKCRFSPVAPTTARDFHAEYHLQGTRSGEHIGVYSGEELLAVATFRTGELARWTVKFGVVIVGALSKVVKHYGREVFSFCDTGKHTGEGYLAAGFKLASEGVVSYHYTDGYTRTNRQHFQKHKLLKNPLAKGNTEQELAQSLGYYQIGGCRQAKYVYSA